ncbi:MAG: hypothetical protein IT363_00540 [Methanoregulaceae archaeon]|nr:hypothetical protein [Methanoregulaceae archaeon]
MPRWRKRLLACVATLWLIGLVLLLLELRPMPFDSARWKSAERGMFFSERTRMVGDLGQNHLRPGMTREGVIALMGNPLQEFVFRDSSGWDSMAPGAAPDDTIMTYPMADGISAMGFSGLVLIMDPNRMLKSWHVWSS